MRHPPLTVALMREIGSCELVIEDLAMKSGLCLISFGIDSPILSAKIKLIKMESCGIIRAVVTELRG